MQHQNITSLYCQIPLPVLILIALLIGLTRSFGITAVSEEIYINGMIYKIGTGAKLHGSNLSGANLSGKNLANSDFSYAWLFNANLSNTILSNADLSDSRLDNANLSYASLTKANLSNSQLAFANLSNSDLSDANLSNANPLGVTSGYIKGTPSSLPPRWSLINGYLIGPGANLSNADLSSNNLAGTFLSGAKLDNAILYGVSSGKINGLPDSLPSGWSIVNGYLIGPGANLTAANLSSAYLFDCTLFNANLTNAIFSTNTIWPLGYNFLDKGALGPGVDFQGENLSSNDLSEIDFTAATFTNCNLTGCNFSGCILIGANFTGAKMTGVNMRNAVIATGTIFPNGFNPVSAGAIVLKPAPAKQTITFPAPPKITYRSTPILLKAFSSSKLPVSFIIGDTNILTLSNTNLVTVGVGTTTVTAIQTGNTNFSWATPVTQKLIIIKALQTITFPKLAIRTYGEIPFKLTASSSSKLPLSYASSNPKVAIVSGYTITLTGTGNTTITATQPGNLLYTAAKPVTQVLTVKAFK